MHGSLCLTPQAWQPLHDPTPRDAAAGQLKYFVHFDARGTSLRGPVDSPLPCFLRQAMDYQVPPENLVGIT
jgi:hypothetical protein